MKNGTAFLSCFFAAMAGLCLVGGVAILAG